MNWKFYAGVGFIAVGYLMHRWIKGEKPASEKNNWKGQLTGDFISYWMWLVVSITIGIVFVIESK
ncbi:MAG TPA: hypothetical protein VG367_11120 [Mucilaginibacter sp.]|jgi:hypothetical protein|nr:hypothetical protein [Mucilaginibacter sp.]